MRLRVLKSMAVFVLLSSFADLPRALAQSPAVLSVQFSAGATRLTIAADADTTWTIEYVNVLSRTNNWLVLTNVTLSGSPYVVVDSAIPRPATRYYRAVLTQSVHVVTTNMVWISPGTFIMGSPANEAGRDADETQHTVTLTQGFYIGQYLVTQRDYLALEGYNPSYFNGVQGTTDYGTDLSRPVETVYWYSASSYCAQLTQQEQQAGHIPTNWVYRLPTEGEWEFACRAGSTTEFSYGEDPSYTNLVLYAWYDANSGGRTQDVGTLLPNAWNLFDMEGDAFEWCQDWYGPYPSSSVTDPQGPASGSYRVFRGGSWAYGPADCRCAGRYSSDPGTRFSFLGFRVVLSSQ